MQSIWRKKNPELQQMRKTEVQWCEASLKSKSEKKSYKIFNAAKQQPPTLNLNPPSMVSDCISKGCPKEIEKNYPLWASGKTVLITLCTFKHIPEWGGKKEEKKEGFFGQNSREKKMKGGRLNYKRRLKNTKHYFTKWWLRAGVQALEDMEMKKYKWNI